MTYGRCSHSLQDSRTTFNPLPAVVIGGPPHSGKSVLAYSLTRALRELDVPHYVLRAYPPDGEGDWFQEGEPGLVRHLRLKGANSQSWLGLLRRDVARRHLPLIVDLGGLPTLEQEALLDDCTHAVLLTPDEPSRQEWAARFARHGLVPLADLRSDLHGQNRLDQPAPLLAGTLAGLERGRQAEGPAFSALGARLAELFNAAGRDLRRRHLESAPVDLAVDLDRLAGQFGQDPAHWQPESLPAVLDYLPTGVPLALYGRGPNWLYAAVAAHALPEAFYLFDARLGWVEAPCITPGTPGPSTALTVQQRPLAGAQLLAFALPAAYLDITEVDTLAFPVSLAGPDEGLVLSGKLPHWLWAALVRGYDAPWTAAVQPRAQGGVVVRSLSPGLPVGTVVPVPGVTGEAV